MRRYYIDFGILLILSTIDFAVAAPVPIQRNPQSDIYVVHTIEHPKTKLRKRGDEDGLLFKLIGYSESHSPARPEEPQASQPSSSLQSSGSSDVPTDVESPAPPTPKEPSQVPSPGHAPPVPGMDGLNDLWSNHYGHRFSDDPLAPHFLWGPPPSGSAQGSKDVEQLAPSIHNEPSQVGGPGHAPPVPDKNVLDNLWLNLYGHRFPGESVAAHPSWSSPPLGSAHGWPAGGSMHFDQSASSIRNDLLQLAATDHVPPAPGKDALNKLWPILYGDRFTDETLAAHSPSGSAQGSKDVEQPAPSTPKEPSQLTRPGHAPPNEPSQPAADPSWGSPPRPSGPGWLNFDQSVPSIPKKPSQVTRPGHAPPNEPSQPTADPPLGFQPRPSGPGWFNFEQPVPPTGNPNEPSQLVVHPSGSSPPSRPAHGWTNVEQPGSSIPNQLSYSDESLETPSSWGSSPSVSGSGWNDVERPVPSIPNDSEPPQVASLGHAQPVSDNGQHFSDESLGAHPSWAWQPSGSSHDWMDVDQPVPSIPNELSYGHEHSDVSLGPHPLGSPPPGPTHGWKDVEQPEPSILSEPSQVASPGNPALVQGNAPSRSSWFNLLGHPSPDESLAPHPSLGSPPPGPTHGWNDVEQLVPSIPNEPLQVASPNNPPPVLDNAPSNNLWLNVLGHPFPDESFAPHPSLGSPPPGPTHGWNDVEQLVPSIPNEPLQVASPSNPLPVLDNAPSNNLWLNLLGHPFPDKSFAPHPSLGSPPSGFAQGWKDVEQPEPSISNEPSQVASPSNPPPVLDNAPSNNLWLNLLGHPLPDESSALHPSLGSPPPGLTHGWNGVGQPEPSIPNEPSQVQVVQGNALSSNPWFNLLGHTFPDESLAPHPSLGSPPPGLTHGWNGVQQPEPSIPKGPSQVQVASPGNPAPVQGNAPSSNPWFDLLGHPFPNKSLAPHPSLGYPPPGPTHGWNDVEQLEPSILNEPSQVAGPSNAPPVLGNAPYNNLWLDLLGHPLPDESLVPHPSLGSPPPGLTHGWNDVEQSEPSIPNEPSQVQVASPGNPAPVQGNAPSSNPWFNLLGHPFPDESLAPHPSLGYLPPRLTHGWNDVEQPEPSIPNEPSQVQVASSGNAPPVLGNAPSNNLWLNLLGHPLPDESLVPHPSLGSPPPGLTHGWNGVEQPEPSIPNEPSQVQVTSPGNPAPVRGNAPSSNPWFNLLGNPFPDESFAPHPSLGSPPSGFAQGWKDVEQSVPSIPKKPSQVASPSNAPPVLSIAPSNNLWLNLLGHPFPDESFAPYPSFGSSPLGFAQGWKDVEQSVPFVPKEPLQVAGSSHPPPFPDDDELNY